jgi:site-specific recombinase XerD
MPTFTYFVTAKKRDLAPIYVRLSGGRNVDLIVKTLLSVNPDRWSNDTETIKQRIKSEDDEKLIKKLKGLKDHIETEYKNHFSGYSKEWLESVVYQFHTKRDIKAKNLNDYIDQFINDAKEGTRKNKSALNLAPGTIRILEGFKRIFGEYQGIYTPERIEWHKDKDKHEGKEKPLRPLRKVDFENINIDFYNSFVNFLSDEGYALNTQGRFIKSLKMMMKKSLQDKLHNNRDFEYEAFRGISEKTFAVYLTKDEIDKIYKKDLTKFPRMKIARDAFIVLCETCLRISDYSKIDINIRTIGGKRFIDIQQTKTGGKVIIPLTQRFEAIWKDYGNKLPRIPEQYVNEYIKIIAKWCEINEEIRWEGVKFGKKYQRSALKWELITCHSGRRSACTNMYLAGIPLKDIREISGHSSDKQLLDYIKITKEQTALRLSDHSYFSGNVLKIAK